jgi:uncharacterized protein (DUF302 family)
MDTPELVTTAFIIDDPFDSALARIRRTLSTGQLSIAGEIDAAHRVKRTLDIYVPACRILLVDNPTFMLEATAIDRTAGIFMPLHLVVSAAGSRTLVHMLNLDHIRHGDLPIGVRAPVVELQRQLARALATIAQRVSKLPEDEGEVPSGDQRTEPIDGHAQAKPTSR